MRWFKIAKWGKYQHYGKPNPPWLKLYTSINDPDTDWHKLNETQLGQIIRLMVYASKNHNTMMMDNFTISQILGFCPDINLNLLEDKGIIESYDSREECQSRESSRQNSRENSRQKRASPSSEFRGQRSEGIKDKKPPAPKPKTPRKRAENGRAVEIGEAMVEVWNYALNREGTANKSVIRAVKLALTEVPDATAEDFANVVRMRVTEEWVAKSGRGVESMIRVKDIAGHIERAKEHAAKPKYETTGY